jgi:hypothetical protein
MRKHEVEVVEKKNHYPMNAGSLYKLKKVRKHSLQKPPEDKDSKIVKKRINCIVASF